MEELPKSRRITATISAISSNRGLQEAFSKEVRQSKYKG